MLISKFGGASEKLYVDDVFSTYLYTGNGATQTITNGIDLAGKGGTVHIKNRVSAEPHRVRTTSQGATYSLCSNTTASLLNEGGAKSFTSSGFTLDSAYTGYNAGTEGYVSWTFRNADKFYWHDVVTKSAGSNATINFANLGTLGMVRVKRTDSSGSWYVWHRSLTAGKLLIGETTAAEATLGHITVSGTTVTLVNAVIADGAYLVEAFAHDASADGIIQCGSYAGTGAANNKITLPWEPQFLLVKRSVGGIGSWELADNMRGVATGGNDAILEANNSNAEVTSANYFAFNADGFTVEHASDTAVNASGSTYTYLAIRRSNKPPTSGTEVYNAIARTGTGAAATVTGVGFAPDALQGIERAHVQTAANWFWDRLRGAALHSNTNSTAAEVTSTDSVTGFSNDGCSIGADVGGRINFSGAAYINHFFRRAPGVFDQICYGGSGANKTEAHTLLGVPPELWRAKRRNGTGSWVYGSSLLNANEKIVMPSPNGRVTDATAWNSTYPTATQISLGTLADVNASGGTYTLEMWTTLAGVSKVGKYTGNGSSQNVECGFSAGARFVMIIRMTAGTAQDIYVFDTARGIVSGNDPHLSLNSTAAEVTTDDSIDPYAGGFAVNQNAATNINVNGAEYLFLAYA